MRKRCKLMMHFRVELESIQTKTPGDRAVPEWFVEINTAIVLRRLHRR